MCQYIKRYNRKPQRIAAAFSFLSYCKIEMIFFNSSISGK